MIRRALSLLLCAASAQASNKFFKLGRLYDTDKVTNHMYDFLYDAVLPRYSRRPSVKLLEIGLGCGMPYGAGHSVPVWREYFRGTQLDLWVADFDETCARNWSAYHPTEASILYGDQSNLTALEAWKAESGGSFDVIVDDGRHSWKTMTHAFHSLWPAVAPGGVYVIEDLQCSNIEPENYADGPAWMNPQRWIIEYQRKLMVFPSEPAPPLPMIKSIACYPTACVFTKCSDTDDGSTGSNCADIAGAATQAPVPLPETS